MQRAIKASLPLPFLTPTKAAELRHSYNMASNWGYPPPHAYTAFTNQMGVRVKDVKKWYTKVRKALGCSGNFHVTLKCKARPPTIEVKTRLPITAREKVPSASHVPDPKGKYMKEDSP